ncbi:MAG: hypothetical protein ACI915_005430 [Gammaproteobacteria bacterium]|jgi:hypothetical protein
MDFWKIISDNAIVPFNIREAAEHLEPALKGMPELDVLEFCVELDRKMNQAYTLELWGIAYLRNGEQRRFVRGLSRFTDRILTIYFSSGYFRRRIVSCT